MDILIFGGQSNMVGLTGKIPEPNPIINGAVEYRFLEDKLVLLKHPVGENWDVMLQRSIDGGGSLIPYFCSKYIADTGKDIVVIHAAKESTTIAEWQKGTQRFYYMSQKIRGGIEKAKERGIIDHIYYIWLQGEGDAVIGTTEDEYVESIIKYKDILKREFAIDKFCIIKVGYFFCTSQWHTHIGTYDSKKMCDEAIMRAQERVVSEDDDFIMLTRVCSELSLNQQFINPQNSGHYNNEAMKIIGSEAARELAKY